MSADQGSWREFVLSFARFASQRGWSDTALQEFSAKHDHPVDQKGSNARDLGWELNNLADTRMQQAFPLNDATFHDLFEHRFATNFELKPAVKALARSDFFHPVDTLKRTRKTVKLMWECHGGYRLKAGFLRSCDEWALVIVYSLAVVVWLLERDRSFPLTRRVMHALLWAMRLQ